MPGPRTAAEYLEAAEAEARRQKALAALAAITLPPEPEPEPVPILDPGPPQPVDPEVVVVWQGEWAWEREYVRGQLVSWQGSTYLALEDNQTRDPTENPGIWALVAARGRKGDRGPAGQDGAQGPRGWTGNPGASIKGDKGDPGDAGTGGGAGPFTNWVPDAVSQGSAVAYTLVNARAVAAGKLAMISLVVTFTGAGMAGQPLTVTLPPEFTLASNGAICIGNFLYRHVGSGPPVMAPQVVTQGYTSA